MEALDNVDQEEHLYSLTTVENLTDIPVPTLRKYLSKYRGFIRVHRLQRGQVHLDRDGLDKVVKIRLWTSERKDTKTIKALLKSESGQVKDEVENAQKQSASTKEVVKVNDHPDRNGQANQLVQAQVVTLTNLVKELGVDLKTLKDANEHLQSQNKDLIKQIEELKQVDHKQQKDTRELLSKAWDNESKIRKLENDQRFWATVKRWLGL